MDSNNAMGTDSAALCLLSSEEWSKLEQKFGAEYVASRFMLIGPDTCIFD